MRNKEEKKSTVADVDLKVQLEAQELKKDQECMEKVNAVLKEYNRALAAILTMHSSKGAQWQFTIVRK